MADKQHHDQAGAGTASKSTTHAAAAASETARHGAETVQQGGRVVGDALRRAGEAGAEASRLSREAGAEAMHRTGDAASQTVRRSAEAFAESQRQFVQDATERFEDVSRRVAQAVQGTTEDMRTLMVLPNSANGGLQDLQQSMTGLVEGVVRTNLRATQELFRLANPGAIIEFQQRFVRDYLDAVMEGTATLVRATRRTADETLRPLEQQIEQRRRQARRDAQYYQNAAE